MSATSRSSSADREDAGPAPAGRKAMVAFAPVYGPVLAELEGTDALPLASDDSGSLREILAALAEESGESTGAILNALCNELRAQARKHGDATAADSGAVFLAQARDLTAADGVFERALLRQVRADVDVKPSWRDQGTFKRSLQNYYYIVKVSRRGRAYVWLVLRRTARRDRRRRAANEEASVRDLHAPPPLPPPTLAPLTGAKRGRDELEPTDGDDRPRKMRATLSTAVRTVQATPRPIPVPLRIPPLEPIDDIFSASMPDWRVVSPSAFVYIPSADPFATPLSPCAPLSSSLLSPTSSFLAI